MTVATATKTYPRDGGIEIAVFSKRNGALSKQISLGRDGKVVSDGSACRMTRGVARRVPLNGVASLAQLIDKMPTNEQLCCWLRRIAAAMQHYRGA
jgi:hypothetical protein